MCQLSKGAQFKMKREKAKKLSCLFSTIRLFRDLDGKHKKAFHAQANKYAKSRIIAAIGCDDLPLAKLIHKRAKAAGLSL